MSHANVQLNDAYAKLRLHVERSRVASEAAQQATIDGDDRLAAEILNANEYDREMVAHYDRKIELLRGVK